MATTMAQPPMMDAENAALQQQQLQAQQAQLQQQVVGNIDPSMTMTSLYVGDLHPDVNEAMLFEKFNPVGVITSIRVCRDHVTRRSLRYAYVNFQNHEDAKRALEELNFEPLKDRAMRISWSNRDPSVRRTGAGNIFIKNLDRSITSKELLDTFQMFGDIMSCKVATDDKGESKGYGFVHFIHQADADQAMEKVNGMTIGSQEVTVAKFLPKKDRADVQTRALQFTNVYVKNLPESMTDDEVEQLFSKFGKITSHVVMRDADGKSKRFGFVNFEKPEEAAAAVEGAADLIVKSKGGSAATSAEDAAGENNDKIFVGRAQKKGERRQMLEHQHAQMRKEREAKTQGVNLYIKNLDENIDDEALRNAFDRFGTITSVRVMRDAKGQSKGFGFVCFSAPEQATKAMTEMSSAVIAQKPLYIAPAQRKADREALMMQRHQMQFRQQMMSYQMYPQVGMQPMAFRGAYPPQMQQRPPRGQPGWQQHPQQIMMMQQRQQMPMMPQQPQQPQQPSQRGGRRPGGSRGQPPRNKYNNNMGPQQRPPMMPQQQQMMMQQPMQAHGAAPVDNEPLNASVLAAAPEPRQKQMLGEKLYPLIQADYGERAGKITGMLLAMDNSELLHLLEDEAALKDKAAEAQRVLEDHQKKVAEQS